VGNRNERMEAIMNDQARSPALPRVVDRKSWQEAREALLAKNPEVWRMNGRPIAQWSRIESGRGNRGS
jgi:hypothetical protein